MIRAALRGVAAAAVALCIAGCGGDATLPAATVPAPATSSTTPRSATPSTVSPPSTTNELAVEPVEFVSPPRRVVLPTIEVDAPIIDLGLTPDGSLETPTDFDDAGWWAGGTGASEPGPTVIVGHVDDQSGPAVFFRLSELEPGDPIVVVDDQGRETSFVVVDKGLYDKESFPTERVYGPDDEPTLRLVTCGGDFDRSERSYESNWVVYAVAL